MGRAVTDDNVRLWRKELSQLVDQLQEIEHQRAELERKLEAAAVLGLGVDVHEPARATPAFGDREAHLLMSVSSTSSLPDAILALLELEKGLIGPPEIRNKLIGMGLPETKFGVNNSYLYTVLRRLQQHGKIRKHKKKYRIIQ